MRPERSFCKQTARPVKGLSVFWLLGIAIAITLVVAQGFGTIARTFASSGWCVAVISLYHVLPLAVSSMAWAVLIERRLRPSKSFLLLARWIAESVNNILPVAQVGGDVVRARMASRAGVPPADAAASVIGDVTAGLLTELAFAALGFVWLLRRHDVENVGGIAIGLAVLGALATALLVTQRSGVLKWLIRRLATYLGRRAQLHVEAGAESLASSLSALHARRAAFAGCCCGRFLGWTLGAGEVYVALRFLRAPVSILDAMMLEGLSQAIRTTAFFVPGALGVQEGGLIVLGGVVGLAPELSLTLSLIKRARELLLGIPGLVAWQLESRIRSLGADEPAKLPGTPPPRAGEPPQSPLPTEASSTEPILKQPPRE
ncbi:MAG TPA: lysylphosphatidylglycerol synthase domain-containing protein [Planctomycetota bacterium]|nr:lysylphosphatidylglycerol synthase domain-containing protein [Planctomycetota bacterium]